VVIRQMSEQNRQRPELVFEKMDVMNMDYKVGTEAFRCGNLGKMNETRRLGGMKLKLP
jgi:hypothetical protein